MFKYKYKYLGPTPQVQYEYKYFKTVLEYKYQVLYICDDAPTRSIKKVYDMCIIHGWPHISGIGQTEMVKVYNNIASLHAVHADAR